MQSHLGNDHFGFLFLTIFPKIFNTLSQIQFVTHPNPGPDIIIPPGATVVQISALRHSHTVESKLYKEYDDIDKVLKQLLIGAVDSIFFTSMRHCYIGLANFTTLQILTHL